MVCHWTDDIIAIPKRTFFVCSSGISGEFGGAFVRILARRSGAKMPMVRPNEPYMVQVYVTEAYNTIMGCN